MARPESTSLVDWPIETLKENEPFSDPLVNFPGPDDQAKMLMEMAGNIIAKRDRGEKLNRMERTIMVGTNNHSDRIPTYSFFTDGPSIHYGYTVREVEKNPKLHAEIVTRWTEEFGFEALGRRHRYDEHRDRGHGLGAHEVS